MINKLTNYLLLTSGFILIFFTGCLNSSNIKYKPDSEFINVNDVKVKASLEANMNNGELKLHLKVQNNSGNKIRVDYSNCSLLIDSERGSTPEFEKTFKSYLSPGETEVYKLHYHPVNNLDFFYKINYRGDLKSKYALKLNFIKAPNEEPIANGTIYFSVDKNTYTSYLNKFGREKNVQLFDFGFDCNLYASEQEKYLSKIKVNKTSYDKQVFVSNSQIITNNGIISVSSFKHEDSLVNNIMIFNNGTGKIKAKLDNIIIREGNDTYYPKSIFSEFFSYNQIIDSCIIVKQGSRLNIRTIYKIPKKIEKYEMSTDWILIQNNTISNEKLLHSDLFLKKLN